MHYVLFAARLQARYRPRLLQQDALAVPVALHAANRNQSEQRVFRVGHDRLELSANELRVRGEHAASDVPSGNLAARDTRGDMSEREGPGGSEGAGHGLAQGNAAADPVEVALADALRRAALTGAWETVANLTVELRARREVRANVVDLREARAQRRGNDRAPSETFALDG
jgi:hypothetical protein